MGSDHITLPIDNIVVKFQSTLPVWGATSDFAAGNWTNTFQSTLPVWGATPVAAAPINVIGFQSTLPAGGATSS